MGATVIQHHNSRRKRDSGAWAWTMRRAGVLSVTVLGLAAATWLAPQLDRPAAPLPPPTMARFETATPSAPHPDVIDVDIRADLTVPAVVRQARAGPETLGVPLNAAADLPNDDYEILSATELASISQARD